MTPLLAKCGFYLLAGVALALVGWCCCVGMWLLFDKDAEHAPSHYDTKGR